MTEPAQSTGAAEPPEPGDANGSTPQAQPSEPGRRARRRFIAIDGWRGIGELGLGFAIGFVIVWFLRFSHLEGGPMSEWFFGAGVFAAVAVAVWQTNKVQRQAKHHAHEAAERLQRELAAAEARSASELADVRELHRVELDGQTERASIQRVLLLELQQRQAFTEVSRAVSVHTHMLATLGSQAAKFVGKPDREERAQAMDVIMEQLGQVVQDFSAELANAHLLIEDDRLHEALNRVNEAAIKAIRVAEDVRIAVVEGHTPDPNPIPRVQEVMRERAADARRLASDLLRTDVDDT